jgi:hypothetical protein
MREGWIQGTERMSSHNERWIGYVVDVNDPEKSGRVKIRIYGMHDDKTRIPDDMLPWARCVFPVTNPVNAGVSGATTGLVVNSTVVGYFADQYRQIPLVDGTLGATTDKDSDFAPADRGDDTNAVVKDNLLHIATAELKFMESKTIGPIEFIGQDISKMLDQIGAGQIKGALDSLKNAMDTFNYVKQVLTDSPIEMVNSLIQGAASDFAQLAEDQIENVISTDIGTIVQQVGGGAIADSSQIIGNVSHLIGAIGTRKSKATITSVEDALNRLSGARFTMANQMAALDSALGKLRISFGS